MNNGGIRMYKNIFRLVLAPIWAPFKFGCHMANLQEKVK